MPEVSNGIHLFESVEDAFEYFYSADQQHKHVLISEGDVKCWEILDNFVGVVVKWLVWGKIDGEEPDGDYQQLIVEVKSLK